MSNKYISSTQNIKQSTWKKENEKESLKVDNTSHEIPGGTFDGSTIFLFIFFSYFSYFSYFPQLFHTLSVLNKFDG